MKKLPLAGVSKVTPGLNRKDRMEICIASRKQRREILCQKKHRIAQHSEWERLECYSDFNLILEDLLA